MAGLTVTEKEHWKDRIAARIDKRIEAVLAEEPHLMERIHREAHDQALVSLGLAEMQKELDAIQQQTSALEKRESQIEKAMVAHVRGVPVEDVNDSHSYRYECEVNNTVTRRQTVHEDELLAGSEIGQRVLNLREEKDNLLDTVWLATSPKQIKELWSKVAELLGDKQTQLQNAAQEIAAVED